jgi:hypothetical protein
MTWSVDVSLVVSGHQALLWPKATFKPASPLIWPILGRDSMGCASAKRPRFQPDRGEPMMVYPSSGERVSAGSRDGG